MSESEKPEAGFEIRKITKERINELLRKGFELRKKIYKEKLYKLVKIPDESWNRRVR